MGAGQSMLVPYFIRWVTRVGKFINYQQQGMKTIGNRKIVNVKAYFFALNIIIKYFCKFIFSKLSERSLNNFLHDRSARRAPREGDGGKHRR